MQPFNARVTRHGPDLISATGEAVRSGIEESHWEQKDWAEFRCDRTQRLDPGVSPT